MAMMERCDWCHEEFAGGAAFRLVDGLQLCVECAALARDAARDYYSALRVAHLGDESHRLGVRTAYAALRYAEEKNEYRTDYGRALVEYSADLAEAALAVAETKAESGENHPAARKALAAWVALWHTRFDELCPAPE
jgi:hypothetical protein